MADESRADGFWVFGYGSLMWNPGFDHAEKARARLRGFERDFCLESTRYRGTRDFPGLVLALVEREGAECTGLAFRVAGENARDTLAYLRDRELDKPSYHEMRLPVALIDRGGEEVMAICYVMNTAHEDYRGHLDAEARAAIIARAWGPSGTNRDYLYNTARNLSEIGVADPAVETLHARVRALAGDG